MVSRAAHSQRYNVTVIPAANTNNGLIGGIVRILQHFCTIFSRSPVCRRITQLLSQFARQPGNANFNSRPGRSREDYDSVQVRSALTSFSKYVPLDSLTRLYALHLTSTL